MLQDLVESTDYIGRRIVDSAVRALTNGKEREVNDWKRLFAQADVGFRMLKIEKPSLSNLGIIVIQWEG